MTMSLLAGGPSLRAQTTGTPQAATDDTVLFDFKDPSSARDWLPRRLPELKTESPAPKVEIVADGSAGRGGLKLTFDGGDWPVVGTDRIAVAGDWKPFQTLNATLTADKPMVAYFRILQGKADDKGQQPHWQRTMILQKGSNEMVITIRWGLSSGVIDPKNGSITSFLIGAFQPERGRTLVVSNVRLSKDWPPPRVTGWYSPYNHDGCSSAVARQYERTGKLTRFRVLGTDLEVADIADLGKQTKDKWTQPDAKSLEQVEAEFRAKLEALKKDHPRAAMAILRDGEKGYDPAQPDKAYAGWQFVYISCHGPDGPNPGREKAPPKYDTVEAFMRHRSPLMQADLSSIPTGASILAARLVVTRVAAEDLKPPAKPNMWVAEPCNRDWDDRTANCYFYAPGKLWKAVSGLYYGEDGDYWPVFLMHGPAGGGVVSDWDFTEALKFWTVGKHANHGFFLYGDSSYYMRIYTPRAKEPARRPAILVIYEPKE
jgi:hypothetical protein